MSRLIGIARRMRIAYMAPLLALAAFPAASALDPAVRAERDLVDVDAAESAGRHLAGPRYRGRGLFQPGNEAAARWLAAELRAAGFDPPPTPPSPHGVFEEAVGDEVAAYLRPFDVLAPDGKSVAGSTSNVIGILRGAPPSAEGKEDASRARECIVLGAHFDHLGFRAGAAGGGKGGEIVFPGADDNASGTVAVLLAARALGRMARDGVRPGRTVVVVFFSGEERGLLGSRAYCDAPPLPLEDTVAMVNLDMVGRNGPRSLEVYGTGTAALLEEAHRDALARSELDCRYPLAGVFARSDHWNFYQRRVPVLFLHSGLHGDYHSVRDLPDRVDWGKVARVARHALSMVRTLADDPRRPEYREIPLQGAGDAMGMALDPATPEECAHLSLAPREGAVKVLAAFAGGPGAGRFQSGDFILRWGGFPLYGDDPVARLRRFVDFARRGHAVEVLVQRGQERLVVSVQF